LLRTPGPQRWRHAYKVGTAKQVMEMVESAWPTTVSLNKVAAQNLLTELDYC